MTKKEGRVDVVLEPGLELLGVLEWLHAGNPSFLPAHPYGKALEKAFAGMKGHPAVALNAALAKTDRDASVRKDALMKRSAPPALAFDETMSANRGESERSGELEPWLDALRAFAKESRFPERLAECGRSLEKELAELRGRADAADWLGKLDRYTGAPYEGALRLVASPLCRRGAVLNRIWYRDDGSPDIRCVLQSEREGGALSFAGAELDACVWHEAAHGVLDTTVHLYEHDERDVPIDLGPALADSCRGWLHGMREHFVRSVMLRLIALDRGPEAAARRLAAEEYGASPFFGKFLAALERYEGAREKYPTLPYFYPELARIYPKPGARPKSEPGNGYPYGPFYTAGQRAAALKTVELLLLRSKDPRLAARRDALKSAAS